MNEMKYLTPKKQLSEIAREREEQQEISNIDLYEAVAGLYEEIGELKEEIEKLKGGESK